MGYKLNTVLKKNKKNLILGKQTVIIFMRRFNMKIIERNYLKDYTIEYIHCLKKNK